MKIKFFQHTWFLLFYNCGNLFESLHNQICLFFPLISCSTPVLEFMTPWASADVKITFINANQYICPEYSFISLASIVDWQRILAGTSCCLKVFWTKHQGNIQILKNCKVGQSLLVTLHQAFCPNSYWNEFFQRQLWKLTKWHITLTRTFGSVRIFRKCYQFRNLWQELVLQKS